MHLHCDVSWTGRVEGNVSRRSTQVNGVPLLLVELLLEAKAGELEKMAKKVAVVWFFAQTFGEWYLSLIFTQSLENKLAPH